MFILEIGQKVPAMSYETMLLNTINEVDAKEHIDDILITNERVIVKNM